MGEELEHISTRVSRRRPRDHPHSNARRRDQRLGRAPRSHTPIFAVCTGKLRGKERNFPGLLLAYAHGVPSVHRVTVRLAAARLARQGGATTRGEGAVGLRLYARLGWARLARLGFHHITTRDSGSAAARPQSAEASAPGSLRRGEGGGGGALLSCAA